ncbi:UDP-N-acetylmuramate--L-alanine ligase [Planctomycetota bacterium]|jgi:UDP-N-acetylmuramate--alanine ligase|nr:UDP-N-acetylmuramate--L-alanine ligase [Planctomycetota bacterium]GDY03594.1 UDP-N-acetylmuramate--L-alanine ligase [Planctomycetota bacterium]
MSFATHRFHLVGVGGSGMSGLARLLQGLQSTVSGSDAAGGAVFDGLREFGIDVWVGCLPDRIQGQDGYVIRSAAVPQADPEVQECVRRGFTSLLYAEAVGRLSEGRRTLAIAGSHGKTTTTGLTVAALRGAGLDPSHLIGGEVPGLGGNGYGGLGSEFVVEACEFNRSFHNLRPFGAAILNLDHDHFDCYPSTEELIEAFAGYLARVRPGGSVLLEEAVPRAVLASLRSDVNILTVGSGLFADIRALDVSERLGHFSFTPMVQGKRLSRIELVLVGRHNMHNALFALGLAQIAGADLALAANGLAGFAGVRRRFEVHAGKSGGTLVNDYAHHPAEIRAVIETARRRFPGRRLLVAFQPHQHQRTLALLQDFAEALSRADCAVVADIYGARESEEMKRAVSANDLVCAIRALMSKSEPGGSIGELPHVLSELRKPDDVVLLLGAGDIDKSMESILARM